MTAPVYRPETYEADMVLAVRDLLGHAMETSHETLPAPRPVAAMVLGDLWRSSDDAASDPIIAETDDDAEDPVRSVRAAIALLWMADADGPGEGWDAFAESLERRLWARGPAVDADADDVANDTARRDVVAHRLSLAAKYGSGFDDAEFAEEADALLSAIGAAHAGDCDGAA